jgi:proteic killer suppression protein
MIVSFGDEVTEAVFQGRQPRRFPPDLLAVTRRKLFQLHAAARLDDLRVPPANRLEVLQGDRAGQHSIRVNDRFRLCFVWTDAGPEEVQFVDYH